MNPIPEDYLASYLRIVMQTCKMIDDSVLRYKI